MKLIILAAGFGSRLGEITKENPKSFIEINGKSMLDRLIKQFDKYVEEIIIVTGFNYEKFLKYESKKIKIKFFPEFYKYNNLQTLYFIKDYIDDDVIISFSDIVIKDKVVDNICAADKSTLAIDNSRILDGTMKISSRNGQLLSITHMHNNNHPTGNFVGIAKYMLNDILQILKLMNNHLCDVNSYYTVVINEFLDTGSKINVLSVNSNDWVEVDTLSDLNIAQTRFKND